MQPGGDPLVLCFVDFVSPAHAATAMDALQGELINSSSDLWDLCNAKMCKLLAKVTCFIEYMVHDSDLMKETFHILKTTIEADISVRQLMHIWKKIHKGFIALHLMRS